MGKAKLFIRLDVDGQAVDNECTIREERRAYSAALATVRAVAHDRDGGKHLAAAGAGLEEMEESRGASLWSIAISSAGSPIAPARPCPRSAR